MHDPSEPEDGDDRPSRSQQRREALATLELAQQLVAQPSTRLDRMDLPADVRAEIDNVRQVTARVAHKRQLAYLAKLMRRHDAEAFAPAQAIMSHNREHERRQTAAVQRLEALRQRLLDEGDVALGELIHEHPDLDRQRLRSLLRQAHAEREHGKPPRATREILRFLREL